MDVSVTKISRNGQIVIPFSIRKALGIASSEKFLVVGEGDTIVLKRLRKEMLRKELEGLFASLSHDLKRAGISEEEALNEVRDHRSGKGRPHADRS